MKKEVKNINRLISYAIILIAIGGSLFLKGDIFTTEIQGKHTWRQSQTYLNIRNFTREDFNILNPRTSRYNIGENDILRMEFPLMQWLIAAAQRLFGESILLVRIAMVLIYLLACFAMYKTITLLYRSSVLGAIGVLIFSFFPVYLYQSINILPDNFALATCLVFLFLYLKGIQEKSKRHLWISALFFSISSLCKLPFILFGIIPLLYVIKIRKESTAKHVLCSFGILSLPIFLWYGLSVPNWKGNNINLGIFDSNIDWRLYLTIFIQQMTANIPLVVIGIPTLVILSLSLFYKTHLKPSIKYGLLFSFGLFVLYFFYILKQIREGHDYYFLPFLPIFTIWAVGIFKDLRSKNKVIKGVLIASLIILPIVNWIKVKDFWDIKYAYFNPDFFIYRDQLRSLGEYDAMTLVGNDNSNCILLALLDKSGYVYMHDHFPVDWIRDIRDNRGVKYLYSDSRAVDEQEGFDKLVDETLAELGSIRVFKLKEKKALE